MQLRRPGIAILAWLVLALPALAQQQDALKKEMIGQWELSTTVRGNGRPICGLTLTNTEVTGDNFQVFLKPKCDPAIAAFGPVQWRLERGQIILMSKTGETWQFEADDNAQWRRVPDSADGLVMLRGQ